MDHLRRYWWLILAVAIAAALEIFGALAEGAGLDARSPIPAVCRITASCGSTMRTIPGVGHVRAEEFNVGTGTLIETDGPRALVITCWHTFGDARGGQFAVHFPDRGSTAARLVASDSVWDLALLEITAPAGIEPIPLAPRDLVAGEPVILCGYGPGPWQSVSAKVLGYRRPKDDPRHNYLIASAPIRDGDSGGPMLSTAGELVGVIWGTDDRETTGTCVYRIRRVFGAGPVRETGPTCLRRIRRLFGFRQPVEAPPWAAGAACSGPNCQQPMIVPGQPVDALPAGAGFVTTPPPAVTPPLVPIEPVTPPALASDHGDPARPPPSLPNSLTDRLEAIEGKLSGDELGGLIRDQLGSLLGPIREQLGQVEGLEERLDGKSQAIALDTQRAIDAAFSDDRLGQVMRDQVGPILEKLPDAGSDSGGPTLLSIILAILAGASPPTLAALGITWFARRGLRRLERRVGARDRVAADEDDREEDADPQPAVVIREDARPRQPLVRRNREFVEVEVPERRLKALQMAHDEYVKRHPAARAMVETIEAFADQFESGMQ